MLKKKELHFLSDFRETVTYRILWKSAQLEPSCYRQTDS